MEAVAAVVGVGRDGQPRPRPNRAEQSAKGVYVVRSESNTECLGQRCLWCCISGLVAWSEGGYKTIAPSPSSR